VLHACHPKLCGRLRSRGSPFQDIAGKKKKRKVCKIPYLNGKKLKMVAFNLSSHEEWKSVKQEDRGPGLLGKMQDFISKRVKRA
jgi:hypothetical protein